MYGKLMGRGSRWSAGADPGSAIDWGLQGRM